MKLSICMMVKNESQHLKKCLDSLLPIMKKIKSELIIVDTGSEDNTVEIAKKYTDKVYFHKWNNNFSEMRNKTISYAKGEWIFIIDGDEVVEKPQLLVKFLKSKESNYYNTGLVLIKSYLNEYNESSYGVHLLSRLFKNYEGFGYEGAIHERAKLKDPVCNIGVQLLHYGYLSTDKDLMERKFHRNVQILKREIEKEPDNIYNWYQLAQSYGMHKDYEEALDAIIKAYELIKEKKYDASTYVYVYNFLVIAYYWNKKYEQTEQICKEVQKIKDNQIDTYFFLGHSQKKLKKIEDAIKSFRKYLELHNKYDRANINSIEPIHTIGYLEEVYLNLSFLYMETGKYEKAIKYTELIQREEVLNKGLRTIIDIFLKSKKFDELKKYYDSKIVVFDNYLVNDFIIYLEKQSTNLTIEERNEINKIFANGDCHYSILNKIRSIDLTNNFIEDKIIHRVKELDFNKLPDFYGDIIYYLIKRQMNIKEIFPNFKSTVLDKFLNYLSNKADLVSVIFEYLQINDGTDEISELRINKVLASHVLIKDKLNDSDYKYILYKYIEYGTKYLRYIYDNKIFDDEMIYDLKDDEEVFLLYLCLGKEIKHKNTAQYIRYLRKALKVYPVMKKAIEILLNEAKEIVKIKETVSKENIKELINLRHTQEALRHIKQYETKIQDDVEIYSMEAIIYIMENKLDDSERVLKKGLEIDCKNFDLLYNLAYLYQLKEQYGQSIELYKKALLFTNDNEIQKEIIDILKVLIDKLEKKSSDLDQYTTVSKDDFDEELETYKTKFKNNISSLIEKGDLDEAKNLIIQYESIISDDPDIYSFKAVLAMMEKEFIKAEKIIKQGLKINDRHFDLLYNLGYLYQVQGRDSLSTDYYKKAFKNARLNNEKNIVNDRLKEIGEF